MTERIAHSLKGSAAQIGAEDLSTAAAHLERMIRNRAAGPKLTPLQTRVEAQLVPLIEAISERLPSPEAAPDAGARGTETTPGDRPRGASRG